jgi:energy-coupling factor transporter ATP-binding protein EcfA2
MKQRVGIARALSIEPKIMLMDEPFSALDALTRGTLQDEVRRICMETGQTVFMIAHDVDEAIYLADRVLLMTNGPNWANDNWAEELAHGRVELNRGPLQAVPGVFPSPVVSTSSARCKLWRASITMEAAFCVEASLFAPLLGRASLRLCGARLD